MNIYFLINSPYPNYAGGIETWLYNVTQRLSANNNITIISINRKDYQDLFPNKSKRIKIHRFNTLKSFKLIKPFIKSYFVLFDFFLGSYMMGIKLNKIINNNEKSFVIALDSMFCVRAGLNVKKKNSNVKLISSVRSKHAEILGNTFPLFSKYLLRFESRMLNKVDCIWSNGYDTIANLKQKQFNSILMKNGVDYTKIIKDELDENEKSILQKNEIRIASVGTLLPIKGVYELIESISTLKYVYGIDPNLYFIGKGNISPYVKYAKEKNICENVHFLGHKNNAPAWVKSCTISACLSGGSGMSMAAIESMATGTPIIAWDSPVYRQFNKSKQTMLLVKENNVESLVNGLLEILNNYNKYLIIGETAKGEAKNYDWSIICKDLINNLDC